VIFIKARPKSVIRGSNQNSGHKLEVPSLQYKIWPLSEPSANSFPLEGG